MHKILIILFIAVGVFIGCTKEARKSVCIPVSASFGSDASDSCNAEGAIRIIYPLGSQFSYSINNVAYQPSPVFIGLIPGTYVISVKGTNDCINSNQVTVSSKTAGPLFNSLKLLLANNCVHCHGGTNPQAGINFSINCDIVNNWSRIKSRAVEGNPSPMPQGGLLPQIERDKIINWINAGHRFTD